MYQENWDFITWKWHIMQLWAMFKNLPWMGCCRLKFGAVDFSMAKKTDFQSQHEHFYTWVHFWSLLTYVSSSYIEIDNLWFISHSCMYTTKFWRVFLNVQKDNPTKTPSFDDTWFIGISFSCLTIIPVYLGSLSSPKKTNESPRSTVAFLQVPEANISD